MKGKKNGSDHTSKAPGKGTGDRNRKGSSDPRGLAAKKGPGQAKAKAPARVKAAHRRASGAGWHFINLFQACPRKFYFRQLRGFVPIHTAPVLTFGGAFHEGKATFYTTGSEKRAIQAAQDYIEGSRKEYEDQDLPDMEALRVENALVAWISAYGRDDLKYYKILAVEEELDAALYNKFRLTGRADAILQSKSSGDRFLLETKTTGYSIEVTYLGLTNSDQVSCYLWLLSKCHPKWKVNACMPDIIYSRNSKVDPYRGDLIFRSEKRLQEFEYQTVGILNDLSQRVQALATGKFPTIMLFPRNAAPGWCTSFNRTCEYLAICDKDVPKGEIPEGFQRDAWVDFDHILNLKTVNWKGFNSSKKKRSS